MGRAVVLRHKHVTKDSFDNLKTWWARRLFILRATRVARVSVTLLTARHSHLASGKAGRRAQDVSL